jgi:hypothetical protein
MVKSNMLREFQLVMGQTTFYPRIPGRESTVVFGRGSTLVIRDQDVPAAAPDAAANERRYETPVLVAVRGAFGGRTVTVREVFDAARFGFMHVPEGTFPNAYAVRDVLLILCAMGFARADTSSAEPTFTIRPLREE